MSLSHATGTAQTTPLPHSRRHHITAPLISQKGSGEQREAGECHTQREKERRRKKSDQLFTSFVRSEPLPLSSALFSSPVHPAAAILSTHTQSTALRPLARYQRGDLRQRAESGGKPTMARWLPAKNQILAPKLTELQTCTYTACRGLFPLFRLGFTSLRRQGRPPVPTASLPALPRAFPLRSETPVQRGAAQGGGRG